MKRGTRPDHDGTHRAAFERNKKIIYATRTVCGICGKPVDFSVKYPHPLSPCIDHIIPVARGGHPSDMDNLQLAHWKCNNEKADKLPGEKADKADDLKDNMHKSKKDAGNGFEWTFDWTKYRGA